MKAVQDNGWFCDLAINRDSGNVAYEIRQDLLDKYLKSHRRRASQVVSRSMRADGYPGFRITSYSCRGAAQ